MTPAVFKRSIRDLQVWCSSCMVAFAGSDPIGVLIGAKRPTATLIQKIAVHPDHLRQGHGRHLLTSLSSKLAILGPPRIVAEVPESFATASALFDACGYAQDAVLTDYVLQDPQGVVQATAGAFVIPVTIDDLSANGLLGEDYPQTCWERSVETLHARRNETAGIAIASDERIEAYILYTKRDEDADVEILSLRSLIDDGGTCLNQLLSLLRLRGSGSSVIPKVHAAEIPKELLEALGFRRAGTHRLYAARARSN
jgi:hypothetical protein